MSWFLLMALYKIGYHHVLVRLGSPDSVTLYKKLCKNVHTISLSYCILNFFNDNCDGFIFYIP